LFCTFWWTRSRYFIFKSRRSSLPYDGGSGRPSVLAIASSCKYQILLKTPFEVVKLRGVLDIVKLRGVLGIRKSLTFFPFVVSLSHALQVSISFTRNSTAVNHKRCIIIRVASTILTKIIRLIYKSSWTTQLIKKNNYLKIT
jgi:hypothetical protein